MAKQQKVTIKLPDWVNPDDLESIGDDVLQFIRDRSAEGVGVKERGDGKWSNKNFPFYTQAYADFKGVSRGSVDLVLDDEMLNAMEVLKVHPKKREIVIGYQAGDEINGKVEGNRIGSYGGEPKPRKARDFLGISPRDLAAVLAGYDPVDDGGDE
jgi:hypothetical protein